jgi:hypothetical protein
MTPFNPNHPSQAGQKINVLNEQAIVYWTRHFGITEQQLRNAIFIEGPFEKDVRTYLQRHGLIQPPLSN